MNKNYDFMEFAYRLSDAIYESGKTQKEIGIECGLSKSEIYKYTAGIRLPNVYVLSILCAVLNVSADYLLFGVKK